MDTVVGYRQRFLSTMGRKETDEKFLNAAASVTVDWDVIKVSRSLQKCQLLCVCTVSEGMCAHVRMHALKGLASCAPVLFAHAFGHTMWRKHTVIVCCVCVGAAQPGC